jgi:hypothetical protein
LGKQKETRMDERRKEKRKVLMTFILVHDQQRRTILGYLRDLTLQGAMVIGEHPQRVNSLLDLVFDLPTELEGVSSRRLILPARVARCLPDDAPLSYQVGFEFTQVTPEQEKIIAALLGRYHFSHQMASEEE